MARRKGINIATRYEVQARGPFDTRTFVSTKADLTAEDSWGENTYNGMVVVVGEDPVIENRGLYLLLDRTLQNEEIAWLKIADISFVNSIKKELKSLIESGVGGGVKAVDSVINLPGVGKETELYLVKQKNALFRWNDSLTKWDQVSMSPEETKEVVDDMLSQIDTIDGNKE